MCINYDVVICGGGLAGLTLAIQLKSQNDTLSIAVLEKLKSPLPLAAFKVGESTTEIGSHYLSRIVGMQDHLENKQIKKMGLRFFLAREIKSFMRDSKLACQFFLKLIHIKLKGDSLKKS